MTVKEFHEYLEANVMTEEDRDNVFPPALDAQIAVHLLKDHFLGEDWYCVDPICNAQVNTVIVYEILRRFPRSKDKMKAMRDFVLGTKRKKKPLA